MSIQGVFNTKVTESSSMWVTASFVQFTALLVCLGAWTFTGREPFKELLTVEPKYLLLGGIAGAAITYTVIKSMDSLGPEGAIMLIVGAQLITGYLIELLGAFGVEKTPFSFRKILGLIIMILGIVIFKWK